MTKVQQRDFAHLEKTLDAWRTDPKKSKSIPSKVWEAAVGLAKETSVGLVARTLRLDHGKLKRLVEGQSETKPAPVATFMKFQASQFTHPNNTVSCALEVESVSGSVLRARLDGVAPADLGSVFRSFGG